ncbi:MAG TPA: hypothetical protein DCM87_13260 [Planctomycetes bacterium]|nr:hypothetical protein [Planctomycetota bacterium]
MRTNAVRNLAFLILVAGSGALSAAAPAAETVRQRLWIWGHPAGVYNESYLVPLGRTSSIEPVDAARHMGIANMIFVRDRGTPAPPFDAYYGPFRTLDRVYWSLVAAGGRTSQLERDAALALAERNENIAGFILDDFFPEPAWGNAADPVPSSRLWFADNKPSFPVTLTVRAPRAERCDAVELVQTDWLTGDYRAKTVAIELSADGETWNEAARGVVPTEPRAVLRLPVPETPFAALRILFLDTHDRHGAFSVGLGGLRLLRAGRALDPSGWTAAASSTYQGYDPSVLLAAPGAPEPPFKTSLTPADLRALGEQKVRGRRLPIMCVIYTRQIKERAKAHLAEVDQICMWTWRPADLEHLEANFAALKKLVPGKQLFLGCYMYDFHESKPLPVALMRRQVEQGHEWIEKGWIEGIIFLATANVDVGLEAVDWTREWIRANGDRALRRSAAR